MYYVDPMWTVHDGRLVRELQTADFQAAFALVAAIVGPSEAAGHHPDVHFGWGYVRLELTTHDEGGVTALDWALAAELDKVLPP